MKLLDIEDISQSDPFAYAAQVEAALRYPLAMLIGGAAVEADPGRTIPTWNPANGRKLTEIPNASHTAPIERPHLVDWTVRDFVARRVDSIDTGVSKAGDDPVPRE